ncbi:uncharacterized protein LOC126699350 [Quercus robur]|uniref:uncharacterized protein LOC126699350 n=1 Tax=Quercus robur TaxID=38942 RepID=UPI0021616BD8|nr:uncharacterized protein LOC126699350 [Quercus robur]
MADEQQKGNMEHGVFKAKVWLSITKTLNEQTGKGFTPKQVKDKHNRLRQKQRKWGQLLRHIGLGWDETTQTVTASDEVWANVIAGDNKAAALRKKRCPDYEKLKQLFAPNTATGSLQISSNTPAQIVMKSVSWKRNLPMRNVRHIVPSWMMMIATIPTWRA